MNWNWKILREHGPERAEETGTAADVFAEKRAEMVEKQIRRRGIQDPAVLGALLAVPRHEFVGEQVQAHAYEDGPLPIGGGQTSAPRASASTRWSLR